LGDHEVQLADAGVGLGCLEDVLDCELTVPLAVLVALVNHDAVGAGGNVVGAEAEAPAKSEVLAS
jgi:hypothetical protein